MYFFSTVHAGQIAKIANAPHSPTYYSLTWRKSNACLFICICLIFGIFLLSSSGSSRVASSWNTFLGITYAFDSTISTTDVWWFPVVMINWKLKSLYFSFFPFIVLQKLSLLDSCVYDYSFIWDCYFYG